MHYDVRRKSETGNRRKDRPLGVLGARLCVLCALPLGVLGAHLCVLCALPLGVCEEF